MLYCSVMSYPHFGMSDPLSVVCPWCNAAPGRPCTMSHGRLAHKTHSDRIKSARKAKAKGHDPMCPAINCGCGDEEECGRPDCIHNCRCILIARVRKEERESAARAYKLATVWSFHETMTLLAAMSALRSTHADE